MPVSQLANVSTFPVGKKDKFPKPQKANNMTFGTLYPCLCSLERRNLSGIIRKELPHKYKLLSSIWKLLLTAYNFHDM